MASQEAQKRFEVAQKQYLRDQAAWRASVEEAEQKAASAQQAATKADEQRSVSHVHESCIAVHVC